MKISALNLSDVSFNYVSEGQIFTALRDVSFNINEGEFVAIMGPSGSGKSTLLNILGLLSRPTSGEQSIFESSIRDLTDEQMAGLRNRKIGFVFQSFSLVSRLNVIENILFSTSFSDKETTESEDALRSKAMHLLTRFGLEQLAERLPSELSGGQKQRVAICRALIMNPRLLLADEPTGALDSQSAIEVMRTLKQLHNDGHTVVVITHDADVAAQAERIISVRDGKVICELEQKRDREKQNKLSAQQRVVVKDVPSNSLRNNLNLLRQSLLLARRSLLTHRMRSVLTGLGLFVGILSLIVIDGLGEIVQSSFNKLFYTSSVRKAYIYYDEDRAGFHGRGHSTWRGLHAEEEFPKLAKMFEKKGIIRPFLRTSTCQIKTETGGFRTRMVGVSDGAEFSEMDTPLTLGRFPNSSEFSQGSAVTVLGSDTIDQLFDKADPRRREDNFPVGQRVMVNNCNTLGTFTVIGVLGKRDTSFGNRDANDLLYLPTQSLLTRMGPTFYTWFSILPHSGIDTRNLAKEVTSYLTMKSGGRLTFGSSIPADILDRVRGFLRIVQTIVGFIGLLCLFVGGVGIMNMMLVTVAERTREIGLMKSLGAKQGHIRAYILTEATLLCVIAGTIAVVIGFVANNLFSFAVSSFVPMLKDFRWVFAPLGLSAGLIVSLMCGLGFGSLPAARAAALDPAECLRAE